MKKQHKTVDSARLTAQKAHRVGIDAVQRGKTVIVSATAIMAIAYTASAEAIIIAQLRMWGFE